MNYFIKNYDKETDEKYLQQIKTVAENGLSPGFLSDAELKKFGDDDYFCSFVLDEDSKVIGVSYGKFLDTLGAAELLKCTEAEVKADFPGVSKFADHLGIAVDDSYRQYGLANKMFEMYDTTVFTKADVVFYCVWNRKGGEKACVTLIDHKGAVFFKKIPMYWYDDEKLYCTLCHGRCKCDCDIYYIKKDGMKKWMKRP